MKKILHLDFETRSDLDLTKVGLSIYARGKNTDILCAAFAFDDEPLQLWRPGEPIPSKLFNHIEAGGLVAAHNAPFERDLINYVGTRKHGWPAIYSDQMICTMAMAYAMALPGSLEGCSAALGISEKKDLEGSRIMKQLCKPKEIYPDGRIVWFEDLEKLERLYAYCIQDVKVERLAMSRMLHLSSYEKKIWVLDQKINERGVKVDIKAALSASLLVEEEKASLDQEMRRISGNEIATCSAVAQIKTFLKKHNIEVESIDKSAVIEFLLDSNLPMPVRKVLELRQQASKASTAKLDPMVAGAGTDHRIRDSFQYSAAGTRRWAGRRVQLQNLKRPSLKPKTIESIIAGLTSGKLDRETFTMLYGEPINVVSDLIRAMLVPENGCEFLICDFSSIEARVVSWLAQETETLKVFATGDDIYVHAAASIFGKSLAEINKDERAVGKVAILALGFGGGVGAFQSMAKNYNVKMAPAFDGLWSRLDDDIKSRIEDSFDAYEKKQEKLSQPSISFEEYAASDATKMLWRESNPSIVQYWTELERAAICAVRSPNEIFRVHNVAYKVSGSFLFCRLPSGGVISYPYPEIRQTKTPWGAKKDSLTYMSEESTSRKWIRYTTFGGSLCENVTQAVARDLLADAMLRIENAGLPIVMHIHDEIVCEVERGSNRLAELEELMIKRPHWATGLPIEAKGLVAHRYQK